MFILSAEFLALVYGIGAATGRRRAIVPQCNLVTFRNLPDSLTFFERRGSDVIDSSVY